MLAAVLESAISALKTHPPFKERLRPWYLRNIFFPLFPNRQPAEFIASWKIPRIPAMRIAPAKEGCRDFLFLPMVAWHSRFQRPQLLARAIAKRGHRCFYLNPHLGRQFARRNEPSPQISHLEPGIYELHIRLPREPVFHHRALSNTESTALAEAIESIQARCLKIEVDEQNPPTFLGKHRRHVCQGHRATDATLIGVECDPKRVH